MPTLDSNGVTQVTAGIAAIEGGLGSAFLGGPAAFAFASFQADLIALAAALPDLTATQNAYTQLQKDLDSLSVFAYLSPTIPATLVLINSGMVTIGAALTNSNNPTGGAPLGGGVRFGLKGVTVINNPIPTGGQYSGRLQNQSNIATNFAKLSSIPPTLSELHGYKHKSNRRDQVTTRIFTCAWSVVPLAEQWLLGFSTSILNPANSAQGLLSRSPPMADFKEPWKYCVECDYEGASDCTGNDPNVFVVDSNGNLILDGFGNPTNAPYIAYFEGQGLFPGVTPGNQGYQNPPLDGMARLTTQWAPLPYEITSDAAAQANPLLELSRYVDRSFSYAVQAQAIPATYQLMFVGTSTIVPGNPILIVPTGQLVLRWIDVPDLPLTAINACIGCVNVNTFNIGPGWPVFGPQTLLCQAPTFERYRSIIGRVSWDITYRFDFRPNGWNFFLVPGNPAVYARVGFNGQANQPLFPVPAGGLDFPSLFVAPPPVVYQVGQ